MSTQVEKLASLEMDRHRSQMLYAERQLLKAGDFEALAQSLVRRSHFRLVVGLLAGGAYLLSARNLMSVIFAIVIVVLSVLDHSHTKRTRDTILPLKGEGSQRDPAAESRPRSTS